MLPHRRTLLAFLALSCLISLTALAQQTASDNIPNMSFDTVQIVFGPEGQPTVPTPQTEDNEMLTKFLEEKRNWDDRFATTEQFLPYAELAITSSGVLPAPIYVLWKIVIGQQLDQFTRENEQLEREVVGRLVAESGFDNDRLALAEQLSEETGIKTLLDHEFRKQAGLSQRNWDSMTRDEKDDALITILGKTLGKTSSELATMKRQITNINKSLNDLFTPFAQVNHKKKQLQGSAKDLKESAGSIKTFFENEMRNQAALKIASLYYSGQIEFAEMQQRLKNIGFTPDEIAHLKYKMDLQWAETALQDTVYAGAIAAKLFPTSAFGQSAGKIATAAYYFLGAVKAMDHKNYLEAVFNLVSLASEFGQQANTEDAAVAVELAQLAEEVRQLRREIWEMYGDLVNRIDALYELNTAILKAVNLLLRQDLQSCAIFVSSRAQFNFDWTNGRFPNFQSLEEHFNNHATDYQACRQHLNRWIQPTPLSVQFFGQPTVNDLNITNSLQAAVMSFNTKTRAYRLLTDNDSQLRIGQLLFPSADYYSLRDKVKRSALPEIADKFRHIPVHSTLAPTDAEYRFFYQHFFDFISAAGLLRYIDYELQLVVYSDMVVDGVPPHLRNEGDLSKSLYSKTNGRAQGIETIKHALDLVDLAIAQQAWLGGDALLPTLAEQAFQHMFSWDLSFYFQTNREPDANEVDDENNHRALVHIAVGQNPLLLQNVVRYQIYDEMNSKKYNSFAYAFASYHKEDPVYMNDLIGDKLVDVLAGDKVVARWMENPTAPQTGEKLVSGWYLTYSSVTRFDAHNMMFESVLVPLPSIPSVRQRSFAISSDMQQLLDARERLKSILLGYEFVEFAKTQDKGTDSVRRFASYVAPRKR